jgi:hypothetical protein
MIKTRGRERFPKNFKEIHMNWNRIGAAFLQGLEDLVVATVRHPLRLVLVLVALLFVFSPVFRAQIFYSAVLLWIVYAVFRKILGPFWPSNHRRH